MEGLPRLSCFALLSDKILNTATLGQRVFAATEGAVCVIVVADSADSSSNFSAPLLEALKLVPVLVGMSKSSSCGALMMIDLLLFLQKEKLATAIYLFGLGTLLSGPGFVSEGTFCVSESGKLGVSPGNEEGEEGRNILHVAPLRLLVEVVGEFSPLNAIDLHHLTRLELLKEHLDVPRLCVVHELVVRSEFVPLVGDVVCPFFECFHRCGAGNAWEGLDLFFEGLLDIHGRLIVSGHVVVMESFEEFRPNAVWITVSILESGVVVLCGGCVVGSHCRTKVLKGLEK